MIFCVFKLLLLLANFFGSHEKIVLHTKRNQNFVCIDYINPREWENTDIMSVEITQTGSSTKDQVDVNFFLEVYNESNIVKTVNWTQRIGSYEKIDCSSRLYGLELCNSNGNNFKVNISIGRKNLSPLFVNACKIKQIKHGNVESSMESNCFDVKVTKLSFQMREICSKYFFRCFWMFGKIITSSLKHG